MKKALGLVFSFVFASLCLAAPHPGGITLGGAGHGAPCCPVSTTSSTSSTTTTTTTTIVTTTTTSTTTTTVITTTTTSSTTTTTVVTGGASALTGLWANTGEDKVTQDDRRYSLSTSGTNGAWNGTGISIFGGRNETVAFSVYLEAPTGAAVDNVSIQFSSLACGAGVTISSTAKTGDSVFDTTNRPIELFYTRYLQIKGLSALSYAACSGAAGYDERHCPVRMQRPHSCGSTVAPCVPSLSTWVSRPDHDKYYPDILVPIEWVGGGTGTFTVQANKAQQIWADVYIPKNAPTGACVGNFIVKEAGVITRVVPVTLTVRNFTLPDAPSLKTMAFLDYNDLGNRWLNHSDPTSTTEGATLRTVQDNFFKTFHRHKITLQDVNSGYGAWTNDRPRDEWLPRLSGSLYSSASGYDGPGVSTGENLFTIGFYGQWPFAKDQTTTVTHSNAWESWFVANYPSTERMFYLTDEPPTSQDATISSWISWFKGASGGGQNLKLFLTRGLIDRTAGYVRTTFPNLDISATWPNMLSNTTWPPEVSAWKALGKKLFFYNGQRPVVGSFATEDEGISFRAMMWGQYKKAIDRWYFWDVNYWNNYQGDTGHTNVWNSAKTFGYTSSPNDPSFGEVGFNHSNGDGVLSYPGTDMKYPAESYGRLGPIMSVRAKLWRRGIQDGDYLTMANAVNSSSTTSIVNSTVPKFAWEYGVANESDPSYVYTAVSWPTNPDTWDTARDSLATIIESGAGTTTTTSTTTTTTATTTTTTSTTTTTTIAGFTASSYGTVLAELDFGSAANVLKSGGSQAANGENIDKVNDLSGNGYYAQQTTDAKRPILRTNNLNGYNVAEFDGSSDFMELPTSQPITKNRSGLTIVAVYKTKSTSGPDAISFYEDGTADTRVRCNVYNSGLGWEIAGKRLDSDGGDARYGGSPASGTWYIGVWRYDFSGALAAVWNNGNVSVASGAFSTSGSTSNTNSLENPTLGANGLYDSMLFDGYMAHYIVYDGAMSTLNRDNLEVALGSLYNISVN